MDYETIVYNTNTSDRLGCYLDKSDIEWDRGETTEIALPIFGGFTLDDGLFISVKDFMVGSKTKSIKMVLKNRFGEVVNTQIVNSGSTDLEYREDHLICYYVVDSKLSESITPGTYTLFVYIQNILPGLKEGLPERKIFNKMVTGPSGIEVTVF